jgi:four helix bundle protein
MGEFEHEKLKVYHVALDFVPFADDLVRDLPAGRSYLGDQLHRAATSIVLNVAEGAGEFSRKEKARFYRMALRSATECAGSLDVFRRLGFVEENRYLAGREILLRTVSMLVRLVRSVGSSGTGRGKGTGTGECGVEP